MQYRKSIFLAYLLVLTVVPLAALAVSRGILLYQALEASARPAAPVIVLDPGHGGEDSGAVSCTGARESGINLEISLKLSDLLGLLGIPVRMTRCEDRSIHSSEAQTLSEKKVSDLRNRVRLVSETDDAILVSIHQNIYPEAKYHGAQVFYADSPESEELARALQDALRRDLDPSNHRQAKKALSVYLLKHISCPGVLIECGFLSNPAEEARLRDPLYQLRLACSAAACLSDYLCGQKPV